MGRRERSGVGAKQVVTKGSVVVIALLVASCSTASTANPVQVAAPTTTATSTTTSTTTTSTSTSTTIPTTSTTAVTSGTVGSPEALADLIDKVVAEVGEEHLGGRGNIPFLDINNPDPIAAMKSIIAFDSWVATTWPDPPMVHIYTFEGSQGRRLYTRGANSMFKGGSRVVYLNDPYLATNYEVVEPSSSLSPDVVSELPQGAVVISYDSSSGPFEVRRVEDETVDASSDGWVTRPVVTVIAPSAEGWLIWFEGSG